MSFETPHVSRARARTVNQLAEDEGISTHTVYRYVLRGILSRYGARTILSAQRRGGRWYITDDAWAAFLDALNRRPDETQVATTQPHQDGRRREVERADAELTRLRI